MSEDPRKPLDYAGPAKKWRVSESVLKWLLFVLAVFFSGASLYVWSDFRGPMSGNSAGGSAAGLWIAFALLHVNERDNSR